MTITNKTENPGARPFVHKNIAGETPTVFDCRAYERVEQLPVGVVLSPKKAGMLAIYSVLVEVVAKSIDLNSLVESGRPNVREFGFEKIALGAHKFETDASYPNATIAMSSELNYDEEYVGNQLDMPDRFCDVFAPGTQLIGLTSATGLFDVRTELAKEEDQSAVHSALVRAFKREPATMLPNRRVMVPQYFDRLVRMELKNIDDRVDGSEAQEGRWQVTATLELEIPVVDLVLAQPELDVAIQTSVTDD